MTLAHLTCGSGGRPGPELTARPVCRPAARSQVTAEAQRRGPERLGLPSLDRDVTSIVRCVSSTWAGGLLAHRV